MLTPLCSACDGASAAASLFEETLREQASTESKSGVLRALQVRQRAQQVAERVAAPMVPACELELPADTAYRYRWALELTRSSAAGVEERWKETRVLRRDADGDLALEMQADFRTELGLEGHRSPRWLIVGDQSYVSDDGRAYYRRALRADERERVVEAASSAVQTLLDAVSNGWNRQEALEGGVEEATFRLGGKPLICGPRADSQTGWLRRIETRATPLRGELRARDTGGRRSRNLEILWQLEDGSTLAASFADRLSMESTPVEAPDDDAIVHVERDRSLHRVEQTLAEMVRAQLIERTNSSTKDGKDETP